MNRAAHAGGLVHLASLFIAGALLLAAAPWKPERNPIADAGIAPPPSRLGLPLRGYLDNYRTEPHLAGLLGTALRTGSSVVLLGSSELTSKDTPAKPVIFFNEELGVPLFAIGHAGNQSASLHAQLIAAEAPLENARLVIMISPGWFLDNSGRDGTALEAFLEYQPSPSLYRTAFRLKDGDTTVLPIARYLADHQRELGAAQPVVKWITRSTDPGDRVRYAFSQPWTWYRVEASMQQMLPPARGTDAPIGPVVMPEITAAQWEERYAKAIAEHLAECTNNTAYVNDAYYAEYVSGATRQVGVVPLEQNREFRDFIGLLDFLKSAQADPLFVLQPLNPYVYTNLRAVDPTVHELRRALGSRGFRTLDLWTSDTARFQPGVLTDVMHLGPLGWYRVDSAMIAHFQ